VNQTDQEARESGAFRRHRVLLIEDHADTAEAMAVLLDEVGYDVLTVGSCAEALRVNLEHIDVIVSDLGLPDGSGLELLPRLRQRRYVPALALSGYETNEHAIEAAGFERHATKPVEVGRLFEVLGELVEPDKGGQVAG
jgi:CheY-like chemotaxis protein